MRLTAIRAITFDLDDTLWPIEPVMQRAEQRLDAWLRAHCPRAAKAYPVEAMRVLRDRVAGENPQLAHDFSAQRRLSLREALLPHGYRDDHVDAAFTAFYAERNRVECYADALPALERLGGRYPLAAISNGNADLGAIGLVAHFRFALHASAFGTAKPAADIFHAACERLSFAPEEVLHVGDDPALDVIGAHRAGLRSVWLHRGTMGWDEASGQSDIRPDLIVRDLAELADLLER
ncbi:MAG: HAD-IA family hydrolase [Rudaea sp.]|uniref:HAD family hydrolase n=1 Tax=Rudaea sp. TaxID=2136325 RepID=UPI0039E33FDD